MIRENQLTLMRVSNYVLHECASDRGAPLHILLINSLSQEKLVELWKMVNRVPPLKKNNREDPLSYRSVSLTSVG